MFGHIFLRVKHVLVIFEDILKIRETFCHSTSWDTLQFMALHELEFNWMKLGLNFVKF